MANEEMTSDELFVAAKFYHFLLNEDTDGPMVVEEKPSQFIEKTFYFNSFTQG